MLPVDGGQFSGARASKPACLGASRWQVHALLGCARRLGASISKSLSGSGSKEEGKPMALGHERLDVYRLAIRYVAGAPIGKDLFSLSIPIAIWMRPSPILNGECKRRRVPLGVPRPRGGVGRAEDRLKAELRANARASRADVGATRWESRVHAAGWAGGRPPEGGTPSKCPREPSRCRRDPLGIPRTRGGWAGGAAQF